MMNTSRHQAGAVIAGQKTGGQFKAHERAQADGSLLATAAEQASSGGTSDPFADIRKPEWAEGVLEFNGGDPVDWNGADLGLETVGVTDVIAHGDVKDGNAFLTATRYENPVDATALTEAQWNVGYDHAIRVLEDEYQCEIDVMDDGSLSIEFSVALHEHTINDHMASDLIWEKTELVRFSNESDPGTYGSPHIYSRIAAEIDSGFFPGRSEGGGVNHTLIRNVREDAKQALDGAEPGIYPQLESLASHGYCLDAESALEEVTVAGEGKLSEISILRELLQNDEVNQ